MKLTFGAMVVGILALVSFSSTGAQDDAKKEVMHARAKLEAAAEDYFQKETRYISGLCSMPNIVQGLREWTESEKRGQWLLMEYQKRRSELRVAADAVNIPETTPYLSERQKLSLGVVDSLTAHANEPLFTLFRLMVEVDAAKKAEKKN